MGYYVKGKIIIDSENFWTWVMKQLKVEELNGWKFKKIQNDNLMFENDTEKASIELTEFWEFVYNFNPCEGAEVRYGVPEFKDEITIDFIACDYSSPESLIGWEESEPYSQWKNFKN